VSAAEKAGENLDRLIGALDEEQMAGAADRPQLGVRDSFREQRAALAWNDLVVVAREHERRCSHRAQPARGVMSQDGIDLRPITDRILNIARLLLDESFQEGGRTRSTPTARSASAT